jgi:hypothetical protein
MELFSKHIRWCWDNGIYFVPKAIDDRGNNVKIAMIKKGKSKLGNEKYPQKTRQDKERLYEKIDSLYLQIFEKNIHSELVINK